MSKRKAKAEEPKQSQVQKMLAVVARVKLTTVERAVVCELLATPGHKLSSTHDLWPAEGYGARYGTRPLPYTRQGITNALKALEKRGWVAIKRQRRGPFGSSAVELLPIGVLGTKTS